MFQSNTLPRALVAAGIVLLVAPALFPVQPVLYHDTAPSTMENESALTEQGYTVIAYENLTPRGQEYYVRALRNGGEHFVPRGEGAPEFSYPTEAELGELDRYRERIRLRTVVIERPPNASLPPPDERLAAAERRLEEERERRAEEKETDDRTTSREATANDTETGPTVEEYRRQVARYDEMSTRTDRPPLFAVQSLLRILSVTTGVVALGTGGYLQSKP